MTYLVVRTSMMEVSADIEADSPEDAAAKFDDMHAKAAPIIRVVDHPQLKVEFEPMDQSVWDPEEGAEPLWEVVLRAEGVK